MSSGITDELVPDGLPANKKWSSLAGISGIMIVLVVVSMHAVPIGMLGQNVHAVATQTVSGVQTEATGSPLPYAVPLIEPPSTAKVHAKFASSSGVLTSWVVAQGHTGSMSTTLLIQNVSANVTSSDDFTFAEPCHIFDFAPGFHNCTEEMTAFLKCNFEGAIYLADYRSHKSVHPGADIVPCCAGPYSPAKMSRHCSQAPSRIFKTTTVQNFGEVFPVLGDVAELRVINLVRDPRGTYQSEKSMFGSGGHNWRVNYPPVEYRGFAGDDLLLNVLVFTDPWTGDGSVVLKYICVSVVNQSAVSHPRILHVRFEDIISIFDVSENMISFLGYPWNSDVEQIARTVFPGLRPGSTFAAINHYPSGSNKDYTWTAREIRMLHSAECQLAFASWGYPDADA